MVFNREINEIKGEMEYVDPLIVSEAHKSAYSKAPKVKLKSQKRVTAACDRDLFPSEI